LPVYGQRLQYPATAINVLYGTGCGPATISANNPYAGSEFFRIGMGGVAGGTPAVLLVSLGSAAIPLNFIGEIGRAPLSTPLLPPSPYPTLSRSPAGLRPAAAVPGDRHQRAVWHWLRSGHHQRQQPLRRLRVLPHRHGRRRRRHARGAAGVAGIRRDPAELHR